MQQLCVRYAIRFIALFRSVIEAGQITASSEEIALQSIEDLRGTVLAQSLVTGDWQTASVLRWTRDTGQEKVRSIKSQQKSIP